MVSAFTRIVANDQVLVHINVDGVDCMVPEGEPLATSLLAAGYVIPVSYTHLRAHET